MFATCTECGAELRLNPKLAGTAVSCPQCGGRVQVPKGAEAGTARRTAKPRTTPEPRPQLELEEPVRAAPAGHARPEPFTFFMMAAQAVLFLIAFTCVWAAFHVGNWEPPAWSYFAEHEFALLGAAVAFVFLGFMARYRPVAMTLAAVLVMCVAIFLGQNYEGHSLDASRTIALSLTLLSVWLALEHRRMVT